MQFDTLLCVAAVAFVLHLGSSGNEMLLLVSSGWFSIQQCSLDEISQINYLFLKLASTSAGEHSALATILLHDNIIIWDNNARCVDSPQAR